MADLVPLGLKRVRVSGGEPFLYPGLFELVERGADLGLAVSIQTNGLMLGRLAERINAAPIASLHVSLDGTGAANDALRQVPGHYERVLAAIPAITRPVYVTTTPYAEAVDSLEELMVVCRSLGVAGLEFNLPSTDLFYLQGATVNYPSPEQVARLMALVRANRKWLGMNEPNLRFMERYLTTREIGYTACDLGLRKIYVHETGDVHPACFPLGVVGNVIRTPILDLLGSEDYRERVARMLALKCPGCVCGWQGNPKPEGR